MQPSYMLKSNQGSALVTAMLVMALITTIGISTTTTTNTELQIAGNDKVNKEAFYQAEGGIEYARIQIQSALDKENLTLPGATAIDLSTIDSTNTNTFQRLSFSSPQNFDFAVGVVIRGDYPDNIFDLTSIGEAPTGAQGTIEVSFARNIDAVLSYAAFGDGMVELKSSASVYSYSSCGPGAVTNPTPSDSTGEGNIGSNEEVILKDSTFIDGSVALGVDSSGDSAELDATGTQTITGDTGIDVPRVDPDPLGAIGGDLEATFTAKATNNNNAAAGITGTDLTLMGIGGTMTLTAGDYYFTSITLGNSSNLMIDASSGPVNIYLTGPLEAKNGSDINITGSPMDFTIFSNSTTDPLIFKHASDFKGVIYAPYTTVDLRNSADFYGAVKADLIEMKNSGDVYFDQCLVDKWEVVTPLLNTLSWREDRAL